MNPSQRSRIGDKCLRNPFVSILTVSRITCRLQQTVAALLATLKIPAERVAIELNKTIVRKREWESTLVGEGAQVEIVEFVGGG